MHFMMIILGIWSENTMEKNHWVLKENKSGDNLETARFSISYSRPGKDVRKESFRILSLLRNRNDVILELDSSLLNAPFHERGALVTAFLEDVKMLGLEYRYRQLPAVTSPNMWEQLLGFGKKEPIHQLMVYIPHAFWEKVWDLTPANGVRWYVLPDGNPQNGILGMLFHGEVLMSERLRKFRLIIFDCPAFGQMGIYTDSMTVEDLKRLMSV